MIQLQEAGSELGHVDLHWTLSRAGFAGQAACHGVVDFMGEVLLTKPLGKRIAQPAHGSKNAEASTKLATLLQYVDALVTLQAQPFTNQRSTALGRLRAIASRLPRRAHGVVRIEVVASAVAIALHRSVIALPDTLVDGPVEFSTQNHFVHCGQASVGHCRRGGDLAGVQLVIGVEGRL
ncbi:hypothetical protein D9M68_791340 [compost metagenome]